MTSRDFWRNQSGAGVQTLGVAAACIALAAVAATTLLDMASRNGMPSIAILDSRGGMIIGGAPNVYAGKPGQGPAPKFDQIDRTATASIGKIILDPCTGKQK